MFVPLDVSLYIMLQSVLYMFDIVRAQEFSLCTCTGSVARACVDARAGTRASLELV